MKYYDPNIVEIQLFVTKNGKFRAKVYEIGRQRYEVTVNGNEWKNGKGTLWKRQILSLVKKMKVQVNEEVKTIFIENKEEDALNETA